MTEPADRHFVIGNLLPRGPVERNHRDDLPYLPASGEHLAVMWTNLDAVEKDYSLEFIAGSHRGPLYNPSAFNPDDEAANLFDPAEWPPLPSPTSW